MQQPIPQQVVQQPIPQQVPVQQPVPPVPEEKQGFWQKLRGGIKNVGQKAGPILMETA
jgi:hypothetical protein